MNKRPLIAFALFAVTVTFTGNAQTQQPQAPPQKTLEQIAAETNISVFIPDAIAAAKLTPEEQAAIKLHLAKFMSEAMRQSYQQGAQASSDFFMKEFAKFTAAQQELAAQAIKQSQPTRGQRIANALIGFGQGMQNFNQNMAIENAKRINCISNRVGSHTYTNCY